jgi:hypothetical protein
VDCIAGRLLSRSVRDLRLDDPVEAEKYYRKAMAARIRDAFKKWMRPGDFVQVRGGQNPG